MVRPPFILVLLATSCHLQSVPPPSATSLVLHDSAAVGDSDSLAKTIDEMAKKTGLTLSEDQLGLVKSMASGNFHAKTLTKMMGSMAGDLKKDQKDEFNDFANRVVGWKRKKETIQNKMILELANGTTDAKNMRAYMKKMNLNAIINTVQKTYSGSAEWDRIKAFVDRVNKDPHGSSNKTTTTVSRSLLTTVFSNSTALTTASPSSNSTTTTPSVPSFTFVFVPPKNVTTVNGSTNGGPSWNSIMSLFTSPPTSSTTVANTTGTTNLTSPSTTTTTTPHLPVFISSVTPTNLSMVTTLPSLSTLSNTTIITSNSTLLPTINVTKLPPVTTVTLFVNPNLQTTVQSNTTLLTTNKTGQPVPPLPPTNSTGPLPSLPSLPISGTIGHPSVSPNNGSNPATVSVPLTTPGHDPNLTVLPSTNTTGPAPPSVPPQNPNASSQSSSEETEPETGGPDPLPEKPAHDREIHSGETQNLDVNTEEEGEGVSAEETGEKEGSGEDDISEEGSGEDEPAADEPFVDVEEGSVEEGSGEVDGSGEDSAAEAYVLADNEEPGH